MKDQYDNDVPNDLVFLDWEYVENAPYPESVQLADYLDDQDWYELNDHWLGVSWSVISKWQDEHHLIFDPVEFPDVGLNLRPDQCEVMFIQHHLHRYHPQDGFYHA